MLKRVKATIAWWKTASEKATWTEITGAWLTLYYKLKALESKEKIN